MRHLRAASGRTVDQLSVDGQLPAELVEIMRNARPNCSGLHEDVPQRRRLGGPAENGPSQRVAVSPQSNAFWDPPPTTWITSTSKPQSAASWSTDGGERRRQGFMMQRDDGRGR